MKFTFFKIPPTLLSNQRWVSYWLLISTIGIFALTYFSRLDYTGSDPGFTLLVSQAIIEQHTIRLDSYKTAYETNSPLEFDNNPYIPKENGHYYYIYPIGSPIFSVPFVWLARSMGADMLTDVISGRQTTQKIIAAGLCALIFIVIYRLCRNYLSPFPSFVITFISMLGSSLTSSLGTALWNLNFTTLIIVLTLSLIAAYDSGQSKTLNPFLLSFLLFSAYLCRPTSAIFILIVFAYVFLKSRPIFFRLTLSSFVLFLGFIAWNEYWFREILPGYYTPPHSTATFWIALYGHLFSPSRGIFIFSPFLLLAVGGTALFFHQVRQSILLWLCFLWFGLHIIAISSFPMWWGGHSYGPRILTDVIPPLILITVLFWRKMSPALKPHYKVAAITCYIVLGSAGIFINSYQGLYNIHTAEWLGRPNIDYYPERLFDWKYPQFLATNESIQEGEREHAYKYILPGLEPYSFGQIITPTSDETKQAIFLGWHPTARGLRWSAVPTAALILKSGQLNIKDKLIIMEFSASSQGAQKVNINLNNTIIGSLAISGSGYESYMLAFDPTLLKENGVNQIDFDIPEAVKETDWHNWHQFWLLFRSLRLYPSEYMFGNQAKIGIHPLITIDPSLTNQVSIDPHLEISQPVEINEGDSFVRVSQTDELRIKGVLWSVKKQKVQVELELAVKTISNDNLPTLGIVIKNESGTHTIHQPLKRTPSMTLTGILESGKNVFQLNIPANREGEGIMAQELPLQHITIRRSELP